MGTLTSRLELIKPGGADLINVNDIDNSFDILDEAMRIDASEVMRYVSANTGSDTNDGKDKGSAFLTVQAALEDLQVGGVPFGFVQCSSGHFDLGAAAVGAELGYNGFRLRGLGKRVTQFDYTGIGTAMQFANIGTVELKNHSTLGGFTLNAPNAAIGINTKGSAYGTVKSVEVLGAALEANIVLGAVGILYDCYDATHGDWWNELLHSVVNGFDTGVLFTGIESAGQSNQNTVTDLRVGLCKIGVSVGIGDTVILNGVDATSSVANAVGMYLNHRETRVHGYRCETAHIGIEVGPNAKRVVIEPCTFSNNDVGIQIDAGAQDTQIHDGHQFTGVTTKYIDNGTQTRPIHTRMISEGLIPVKFFTNNAVANMAGVPIPLAGESAACLLAYVGCHFYIRSMTQRVTANITSGSVTSKPTIGAAESTTLAVTLTNATGIGLEAWQGLHKDKNNGATGIGVNAYSSAGFAPSPANLTVILLLQLVRDSS